METDKDVEVKILSQSEAWSLFKEKVGDQVLTSPALQSIAEDVAKECDGLPLALVTVGRALRNATDISEWENALAELRISSANVDRIEEEVFSRLKLSFTKLKDDTSRSCFLFCALYPEGHLIDADELIAYWMWEGLLGGVDKMAHSKRKGRIILDELRYACLLENAAENGVDSVKMHDLTRDMAIKIMNVDPRCIVNAGTRLTAPPHLDEWVEGVQRVSLMRNDLKSINFSPSCPGLTSLLLPYNSFSGFIVHNFFDNMLGLKVLDLSYTGIHSLPESLSNLENFRALLLSHCWNLVAIPSLAKLINLLVLDLSFSREVKQIPHGMEQLCSLRRLDISWTGIEFLPFGLISKFALLEELSTSCSGVLWVSKAVKAVKGGAKIEELVSSSNLCVLDINFWNTEVYNQYVLSGHWHQLNKFKLIVGQSLVMSSEKTSLTFSGMIMVESSWGSIPTNTLELQLLCCGFITGLYRILWSNVTQLKICTIDSCGDMQSIFDSNELKCSMLEILNIFNLKNLRRICEIGVAHCPLTSLRIINLEFCPKLKSLFPRQLLPELINLEEITVCGCSEMEYLIEVEEGSTSSEGDNQGVIFPKLKRLKLYDLPVLKCIYDGVVVCNSLCSIEVWSCSALKRLPLGLFAVEGAQQQLSSPPALEEIKGSEDWWQSLEWDQPNVKSFLQPYFVELDGDLISKIVASGRDKYKDGYRFSKYSTHNAPSSSINVT